MRAKYEATRFPRGLGDVAAVAPVTAAAASPILGWLTGLGGFRAVFVALAVGASALRPLGARLAAAWKEAAERRANARADAQFMAYAAFDPRVMHDLQVAISRHEAQNPTEADVAPKAQRKLVASVPSLYEASRRARMSQYY